MSQAKPERTQFEAGQRIDAPVGVLKPHPENDEIYSERGNGDLAARIEEHGFRESQRIVVCEDGTILSGHRRWDAAKQAGLETVPVEVIDVDPESDEALLELLTANEYRQKKETERYREAKHWQSFEGKRSEERMKNPTQNYAEGETGETREKAAEKVGWSREKFRKADYVKERADGGDVFAQDQWVKLEAGEQSIHGAYTAVKDAQEPDEPDDEATEPDEGSTGDKGTVEDTLSNPATDSDTSDGADRGEVGSEPSQDDGDASDVERDAGSEGDTPDPDPGEQGEPMPSPTDVSDGVDEEIVAGPTKQELQAENKRLTGRVEELEGHLSDVVTHYQRQDVDELGNAVERAEEVLS